MSRKPDKWAQSHAEVVRTAVAALTLLGTGYLVARAAGLL